MDIDVEPATKISKVETPFGAEVIIQESEIEEVGRKKIPSQESIVFIEHFPTIETSQERDEGNQVDPSTNIVAQFNSMKRETTKSIQDQCLQAMEKFKISKLFSQH